MRPGFNNLVDFAKKQGLCIPQIGQGEGRVAFPFGVGKAFVVGGFVALPWVDYGECWKT